MSRFDIGQTLRSGHHSRILRQAKLCIHKLPNYFTKLGAQRGLQIKLVT